MMMYVRYSISLRNVEDLLAERGIDVSYETVRFRWNRFGPMFAAEIGKRRNGQRRGCTHRRWRLDEVFVKIASFADQWFFPPAMMFGQAFLVCLTRVRRMLSPASSIR